MLPEWIDAVWNDDSTLINSDLYKCKIFTGLNITTTGLNKDEKKVLKEKIELNGGLFDDRLARDHTDYLLTSDSTSQLASEKCQSAKKWQINLVRQNWLNESIQNGYCMRCEDQQKKAMNMTRSTSNNRLSMMIDPLLLNNNNCKLFSQTTFHLVEFVDLKEKKLIETELIENGAILTTNFNNDSIDYYLFPSIIFNNSSLKQIKSTEKAVSVYWMKKSIYLDEILDAEEQGSCLLKPIYISDHTSKPLKDCVITVSGFMPLKKELLDRLCELMGAYVQDTFCIRSGIPNYRLNTHLVRVKQLTGPQLNAALLSGIPVVDFKWLIFTCIMGVKQPENEFCLTNNNENDDENN